MLCKVFAFWIVVVGLMAGRVAFHDRIALDDAQPEAAPQAAPHVISTTMR